MSKQFGSFVTMSGHNIPKRELNLIAQAAFNSAMEFVTDEGIDLLNCNFEIKAVEDESLDYLTGRWEPRTSVAWKITVKQESK